MQVKTLLDKSVDQWRDRLKAVVRVNGGHIEQTIWFICCSALLCIVCILRTRVRFAIVY